MTPRNPGSTLPGGAAVASGDPAGTDGGAHGTPGSGSGAPGAEDGNGAEDGTGAVGGSGEELPPTLVDAPEPKYPAIARRMGLEGDVRCRISIDESGRVSAVDILRSSGSPILDEAARVGLLAWRFRPATRGGTPRACKVEHVVSFRLVRVD
jgi:protein TonB